jgi:hypothetical protein
MATIQELENAITDLLAVPGIVSILQLNDYSQDRAFEGYVFALIVKAVRQAGNNPASATICGIQSGENPTPIVLRGGPGRLGSDAQDFAYANCILGSKSFELHLDVQYEGKSTATHEVDVSIYNHLAADRIRQSVDSRNAYAKCSHLLGALECKFYNNDLATSLGRTFVGLVNDCKLKFKVFATNGRHAGLARYFGLPGRPDLFFDLSPNSRSEERFIGWFEQHFRQWAMLS